jgi:hypothetical protein
MNQIAGDAATNTSLADPNHPLSVSISTRTLPRRACMAPMLP